MQLRLITNRKSLQSYIEPILKEILSMKNQKIPEVLKFLFDLVDINNLQHRRAVKEGDYSNLQWKVCKIKFIKSFTLLICALAKVQVNTFLRTSFSIGVQIMSAKVIYSPNIGFKVS